MIPRTVGRARLALVVPLLALVMAEGCGGDSGSGSNAGSAASKSTRPKQGDPCADARGPLEHDHYFTAEGGFGSHDQNGEEVDGGDFEKIDADTVAFPSHAEEFGYEGDIRVDYAVNDDVVTFEVEMPNPCADTCADAHAWALSAFASGPWQRGEVPG